MGHSEFGNSGRALGVGLAVMAALSIVTTAQAQDRAAQSGTSQYRFEIAAKPLPQGLNEIGRITGLAVVFTGKRPFSVSGRAVQGNLTPAQALTTLLAGTGISYRFTNARTVTIDSGEQSSAVGATPAGAISLDTIDVQGAGQGAPVGYVPKNSTVGSKTDTPIIEVPQSISVITPDQLRDQNVQTVKEAVRYTAGVRTETFGQDPRFDWVTIRGFSGTGDYQNGLKLPGNDFAAFRTEPYGLERMDVVKGPVSVLYGQNDPAGLIDRVSKRPTSQPLHEIQLQAGSYDRFQGAFDLGGPIDPEGKLLYRLTGLWRDSDTEINGVKDNRKFIAPALTWQPDSDTTLTILTSYQQDKTGPMASYNTSLKAGSTLYDVRDTLGKIGALVGRPNLYDTYRNTNMGESSFERFDQTQYMLGYQFERRVDDTWTVRQNFRYGHLDVLYNYITINDVDIRPQRILTGHLDLFRQGMSFDESVNAFAVDNQAQAKFNTGWLSHTLLMGIDYQNYTWTQIQGKASASTLNLLAPVEGATMGPMEVRASQEQNTSQLGLYLQDQIKLQNWILTLGVRHDDADSNTLNRLSSANTGKSDHAVTGRAGLTYLFDNGVAPYVSWATSFLPTTGTDFFGSPFKPTTGEQYEAGIKYQPQGWNALFTVAGFQITQQNVRTQDVQHLNYSVQTGEIRSRGVEVEGRADWGYGWKTIASFTYQDLVVTQDNDLSTVGKVPILVPRYMTSGWVDYTIPDGVFAKLGASFGVRYVGENFTDSLNTSTNDALTLYDAAIHYERDNWRFAVNATNLFDKHYETCSGSNAGGNICYLGARRRVIGTASYRW